MTLLDTGYFLALFNPRDALHARAEARSDSLDGPFIVTEYVLWECVNALSKPENRDTAHIIADYIQNGEMCQMISASPEMLAEGLRLHRQHRDKEWSLTDCISFHVMNTQGTTRALAHDHHFEQAGFEALLRRSPPGD